MTISDVVELQLSPFTIYADPSRRKGGWDENGGAKLDHGSGGEVLLRAA
jgi:hypothetical protein